MPTNELNFRNQQMQKWGFSVEKWVSNGVKSGNDADVAIRIDNNLFNQGEEPYCIWLETKDGNHYSIDEMLAQIMREAAEDARKANADATKRFFDEIEKAAATIR